MPCAPLPVRDHSLVERPACPTRVVEIHLPAAWTRRGEPPGVVALRRSGGPGPGNLLERIEQDRGRELPERLLGHPAVAILVEAARRAVVFGDALFGLARDPVADAADPFVRLAALHDLAIDELTIAGAGLLRDPDLGADRPLARAWLARLRSRVAGSLQEQSAAAPTVVMSRDTNGPCRILLRLVPL